MVGLILLPETVLLDFSNVTEYAKTYPNNYPINAVLYSWLSHHNHDIISNKSDLENFERRNALGEQSPVGADWNFFKKYLESENSIWDEDDNNRSLIIIPIHNNRITQATSQPYLTSSSEIYGLEYNEDGREWYGKIHDYVMSFILFYNYTESETHIIHGVDTGKPRRLKLNDEKFLNDTTNIIEIIDTTYFTKLIRTGEFGVRGHFRVQRFGPRNSEAKIIFINGYKKSGYTRGAKIDKNKR